MNRVMVDIETLGIKVGSSILSIGAVAFDKDGLGETFERSISLQSCEDYGLTIDADTLEWWLTQDEQAQEQLTGGMSLDRALAQFGVWYREQNAKEIWANSPSFDCEHLENAFEAVAIDEPWSFKDERDFRTLVNLVDVDIECDGTEHDALDDAKYQATVVVEALNKLEDSNA